jgi:RND family efflux transporter MFP subunit
MKRAGGAMPLRIVSVILRIVIGLGVLGVSFGVVTVMVSLKPDVERGTAHQAAQIVHTLTLRPVSVARMWEGYGTARAMDAADLSAQVTARVIERPAAIEAGATVEAGDLIIGLDPTDFRQRVQAIEQLMASLAAQVAGLDIEQQRLNQQVELAQDEVDVEQGELDRIIAARAGGAGTRTEEEIRRGAVRRAERVLIVLQQQLDLIPTRRADLQAQIAREQANLTLAGEELSRCEIRAPFAGMLQDVRVDAGELVSPGTVVARIVDPRRLEIPLRVAVSAGATVGISDRVELRTDGPETTEWEGVVTRVAPEADPGTRSTLLFVEVEQDLEPMFEARRLAAGGRRVLQPGQFVVGRIWSAGQQERLLVPRRSLNGDRVMVLEDGENGDVLAREVEVHRLFHLDGLYPELDGEETQWAVLDRGLETGQRVIVSNLDQLRDGMRVRTDDVTGAPEGSGT